MIPLPDKFYYLCANLLLSGVVAAWAWRNRTALMATPLARTGAGVALAGGSLLILLLSWWNGMAIYMTDESMYLMAADIYAGGKWVTEPLPAVAVDGRLFPIEYLPQYMVRTSDAMFPMYPMGWPAILAGLRAIVPAEYISPLIGIAILFLAGYYCRRFLPDGAGDGAIWVMALSGTFLWNTAGFTSHPVTGLLILISAIFLEKSLHSGRRLHLLLAVVFCGAAVVARPATGAVGLAALALVIWWRFDLKLAVGMGAIGSAVGGLALALQNVNTTGTWYRSGYAQYLLDSNPFALRENLLELQARRLADTIACAHPLLVALLVIACLHPATRKRSLLYLLFTGVIVVAYWAGMPVDSDSPVGERYYFESLPFVFMAAGMGWAVLAGWIGTRSRWLLPSTSILFAIYPLWERALWHHELRSNHALLLANKEALSRDADLVFVENSREFAGRHYWLNPSDWRHSPTLFLADPGPAYRGALAQSLDRRRWKFFRFNPSGKTFEESARGQ